LPNTRIRSRVLMLALASLMMTGCATAPSSNDPEAVAEYQEINDPGEPTMRAIFAFNQALDKGILKPVAQAYRTVAPEKVRTGVHNFLNNLRTPVIFFNDVLQGEFQRAIATLVRFLSNTTVGILGFNDTAGDLGLDYHNEDFGQTLAVWNMSEGPYLMLPVFGPSNPRDVIGRVVDFFIDPLNIWAKNSDEEWTIYARTAVEAVDFRALHYDTIEDLEKSSLDFYAAVRSLYRQRRTDEINNGTVDPSTSVPGIGQFQDDDQESDDDKEISQTN
ncbi:MAG: VacJ family lipoprotein, partial [Rhodospirillaceae bacterium]|nr:VacJ family lipoprotein [Rhodospirillaceae bacterium]